MKKVTSVLLLFLYIYDVIGYMPVFLLKLNDAQAEMAHQMGSEKNIESTLELLVSADEFKSMSISSDMELSYRGNRYDVLEIIPQANGAVSIKCLSDKRETDLLGMLDFMQQKNSEPFSKDSPIKSILKIFSGEFVTMTVHLHWFLPEVQSFGTQALALYKIFSAEKPSPPPKTA